MKRLGYQICGDGITQYRVSEGGALQRRALYAADTSWENVACHDEHMKTWRWILDHCREVGYAFTFTLRDAKKIRQVY